jgi:hypothetical protein
MPISWDVVVVRGHHGHSSAVRLVLCTWDVAVVRGHPGHSSAVRPVLGTWGVVVVRGRPGHSSAVSWCWAPGTWWWCVDTPWSQQCSQACAGHLGRGSSARTPWSQQCSQAGAGHLGRGGSAWTHPGHSSAVRLVLAPVVLGHPGHSSAVRLVLGTWGVVVVRGHTLVTAVQSGLCWAPGAW